MKRAIRDRPVNVEVPLKIIWNDEATDIYEETEMPLVDTDNQNLVVPGVNLTEMDQEKVKEWKRPENYIITKERTELDYDDVVEYDMDTDDEIFLKKFKSHKWKKPKYKNFIFTPDIFELIMDYLEKESFKQKEFVQLSIESKKPVVDLNDDEDDIPCCVCNDRDYHDRNLIVFCDGCDIAVHQDCQGLKDIPEGIWFCDRCQFCEDDSSSKSSKQKEKVSKKTPRKGKKSKDTTYKEGRSKKKNSEVLSSRDKAKKRELLSTVQCSMCHQSGGAMKRTTANDWIHVLCAYWIPEFFFDEKYSIVNVENISQPRMALVCSVCNKTGGCVQCGKGSCLTAYHPTCAQINAHYMAVEEKKNKGKKRKRESAPEAVLVSFCKSHTVMKHNDALEKAIINGKAKVQLGRFMNIYSKQEVQKRLGFSIPLEVLNETCSYWQEKRHDIGEGRRPLIRRLLIETEDEKKRQEIESDKKRFLLKERTDKEKYRSLREIRDDLEKGRIVIDMLRKREKMKLESLKNLKQFFQLLYNEVFPPPPLTIKVKLTPAICAVLGIRSRTPATPSLDPFETSPNSIYESQSPSHSPFSPLKGASDGESEEIDLEAKQEVRGNGRGRSRVPLSRCKKEASHSNSPSHSRSSSPHEEEHEENSSAYSLDEDQR